MRLGARLKAEDGSVVIEVSPNDEATDSPA
jgi:hypothetical protein